MEDDEEVQAEILPQKKTSLMMQLIGVAIVTLMAAASGGAAAHFLVSSWQKALTATNAEDASGAANSQLASVSVPAIVTNLAEPAGVFVRLEADLIIDAKSVPTSGPIVTEISGDFLGYMRTLSMTYLEGGSGFNQLKEDLTDRAQTRSKGLVHEVVIKTLVIK